MHSYEGLDPAGGFKRKNLLSPLSLRDFRLLWTGMAVSLVGDGVFIVALAWQAYELSGTPTALSLVGLAMTIPHIVFLLIGGAAADRISRRNLMLLADVMRGAAVGAMALLSANGGLNLPALAGLAAVYGAATAFFGPAFDAIVPDVVPKHLLGQANSIDQLVKPLALRLAGPALGGWLIAASGVAGALAFDALTFGVSAAVLMAMRVKVTHKSHSGSLVGDLSSGLKFVRAHVWLWGTFLAAAVAYLLFMGPVEVLLPYIVKVEMGRSAAVLGAVFAVGGIGSVLSAVLIGSRDLPRRWLGFIYICWTLSTLAIAGYGIATLPWQLFLAGFAFNFLESAGTIVWVTTKQRLVPVRLLGRVSSLDWLISIGLLPVSFALTGIVSEAIGARTTLVAAGCLGAIATASAFLLPGMRDSERASAEALAPKGQDRSAVVLSGEPA
jgi:DHA3 family tetracycline resistance protein-like MFS transporter